MAIDPKNEYFQKSEAHENLNPTQVNLRILRGTHWYCSRSINIGEKPVSKAGTKGKLEKDTQSLRRMWTDSFRIPRWDRWEGFVAGHQENAVDQKPLLVRLIYLIFLTV